MMRISSLEICMCGQEEVREVSQNTEQKQLMETVRGEKIGIGRPRRINSKITCYQEEK